MIAVSSVSSSAVTALKLISTPYSNEAAKPKAAAALDPISARSLSPSVSDALLKIAEILNGQKSAVPTTNDGYLRGPLTKLSDLPASDARKLRGLGADAAVEVTAPPISDGAFRALVFEFGKGLWTGLAGFNDALANGTLRIQRASEVPELGLGHVRYDFYNNGNMIGGGGWGKDGFNKDLYLQIQAQGVRQATGSIDGYDYYVTWPDATLAKAA